MPGIPKSHGCRRCKSRKVKCDQNWPVCSSCRRKNLECSGPTSLVKFVHGGFRADHRGAAPEPLQHQQHGEAASGGQQPSTAPEPVHHRFIITDGTGLFLATERQPYSSGVVDVDVPPPKRPLPYLPGPSRPTTVGDRVASRLLNLVHHEEQLHDAFCMGYLQYLPQRIPSSGCLRDAVSLFCSTLSDFRRNVAPSESQTMAKYGKALRSLRRALRGDGSGTVEALASITLVNRVEAHIFGDWPWRPFEHVHAQAVMALAWSLGPPQPGDELYAGLIFENYKNIAIHVMKMGSTDFFGDDVWRQAVNRTALGYIQPHLKEQAEPVLDHLFRYYYIMCNFLPHLLPVHSDPHSPCCRMLATHVACQFGGLVSPMGEAWEALVREATHSGDLKQVFDADNVVPTSYTVSPGFLGELMLLFLSARVVVARVLYDLGVLPGGGRGDDSDSDGDVEGVEGGAKALWGQYRDVCVEMWAFVPFMLRTEPLVSTKSLAPLAVSFEAASADEQELLLDMVERHTASSASCRPTPREEWRLLLHVQAQMLTGRRPI